MRFNRARRQVAVTSQGGSVTAPWSSLVASVTKADDDINEQIDAAYRIKCRNHGGRFVDPMVAPTARGTTIQLVPRSTIA